MTRRARPQDAERTPLTRLSEGLAHGLVGYQLAQATITTNQVFDECMRGVGDLRRVEFTILALVGQNPDVTARHLARALAVTPPNIAIWLDKLEARGLIARTRSRADARAQHIRLTQSGTTVTDRSAQALLDGERTALTTLTDAERAMLVELLHKVALARRRSDASA